MDIRTLQPNYKRLAQTMHVAHSAQSLLKVESALFKEVPF